MNSRWMMRNVKCNIDKLCSLTKEDEVITRILLNRGITSPKEITNFMNPSVESLHEAEGMRDITKATDIIIQKIDEKARILVISDYDVDGIISVFMLYTSLQNCGAEVDYYIPDRILEGYGVNKSIIDKAYNNRYDTIITCDNGIAAIEQIEYAKSLGLTVIITDHHDISFIEDKEGNRKFILPKGDAVVNPKQPNCEYPFKMLCGAGVVFKLIKVLYKKIEKSQEEADRLIAYAAIATVCDVVDLVGENRTIVKNGLKMLQNTENIGLKALMEVTGVKDKKMTSYILGFVLGPCFNATGRLEHAETSLKLLLTKDLNEANILAEKLYDLNKERQEMTSAGVEQGIEIVENQNLQNNKVLVIYLPNLHESIAGIVAGRIRERYNLPTIVITKGKEEAKGSGRSIEEYNMFEELLKCKDLMVKFGGHPMAAGMSLKEENIFKLSDRLNANCRLKEEEIIPKITIDLQMPFHKISMGLAEEIRELEPFGKGNNKPLFAERGVEITKAFILGKNKNVLKLRLKSRNIFCDGIMFDRIEDFKEIIKDQYGQSVLQGIFDSYSENVKLDFIFSIDINEYNGNKYLQLQIKDFRKATI